MAKQQPKQENLEMKIWKWGKSLATDERGRPSMLSVGAFLFSFSPLESERNPITRNS